MKNTGLYFGILSLAIASSLAQPVIRNDGTGIVNAASYSAQGLPNSFVARGSLFTIFGSGLGPAVAVHASAFPLANSLQGVSISVSQGGMTVPAIPLYVSATQINAVMPSNAPLGLDTVVVTFNGQSSSSCAQCTETAMAQVVPSSFGIFTINEAGNGQGVFTTGANRMLAYTSPAAPGEVLNIWGTGLGAIPGSDAEPPAAGNIGSQIPTVYVGGVEVAAGYHGRSPCCSGVDQIQFQVPASVSGCNIPVAVQIGTVVSNFASIAVASPGHACVDPDGISASDFPKAALDAISTGYVGLSRLIFSQVQTEDFFPFTTSTLTITNDYGYANFEKYPYASFSLTQLPLQILNFGACSVYTFNQGETGSSLPQVATPTFNLVPGDALHAGTAIMIDGSNGQQQIVPLPPLPPGSIGNYGADLGESSGPNPLYLTPGSYNVSGIGGTDVGPFSVSMQMPEQLAWTNQSSMNTITRANGVTVTWSGADPNGYIIISGNSFSANGTGSAGFNCTARAADNQFTVPAIVLLALPPNAINESDGINTSDASLQIGIATAPVMFNAAGLDLALAIASFSIAQSVNYQ